jgi:hypothetical protein
MKFRMIFCGLLLCLLSSCLPDETPCTYSRLFGNIVYNGTWNVDSLRIATYDTTSHITSDSLFLNYGTCKFIEQNNCAADGEIIFSPPNGLSGRFSFQIDYGAYGSIEQNPLNGSMLQQSDSTHYPFIFNANPWVEFNVTKNTFMLTAANGYLHLTKQ